MLWKLWYEKYICKTKFYIYLDYFGQIFNFINFIFLFIFKIIIILIMMSSRSDLGLSSVWP